MSSYVDEGKKEIQIRNRLKQHWKKHTYRAKLFSSLIDHFLPPFSPDSWKKKFLVWINPHSDGRNKGFEFLALYGLRGAYIYTYIVYVYHKEGKMKYGSFSQAMKYLKWTEREDHDDDETSISSRNIINTQVLITSCFPNFWKRMIVRFLLLPSACS